GETLDVLYRYDNQPEVEESVGKWLRTTIAQLEEARKTTLDSNQHLRVQDHAQMQGTPLFQKCHPKCANPACPTAFHWLGGGKFFRFRPNEMHEPTNQGAQEAPQNLHGVKHFWLCERCSHIFTLVHDPRQGIVLHVLWPELPLAEARKELLTTFPA
ncbi:MAG: hypothetical protein WA739_22105, partial [Candidatus Acidiferrales bacterium]